RPHPAQTLLDTGETAYRACRSRCPCSTRTHRRGGGGFAGPVRSAQPPRLRGRNDITPPGGIRSPDRQPREPRNPSGRVVPEAPEAPASYSRTLYRTHVTHD